MHQRTRHQYPTTRIGYQHGSIAFAQNHQWQTPTIPQLHRPYLSTTRDSCIYCVHRFVCESHSTPLRSQHTNHRQCPLYLEKDRHHCQRYCVLTHTRIAIKPILQRSVFLLKKHTYTINPPHHDQARMCN